ncbi:MAG TPA: hypothetical protein VD701_00320 [Steroidobacteraceae bacterium]|nr:hypothetical protein [Steroidobacteraceae bacterium]
MNEVAGKVPDTSLVKPAWIVLIVGWVIMLLPIPMTGWLGGVIAGIGGCILAIVNLVRGVVGIGIVQLLCALVVTPIIYWIGLAIFGAALVGAASTAG